MARIEQTKPTKLKPDWNAIETEWNLGQLSLRTIAELHGNGIQHTAILIRAKRKGWPPRPEKMAIVTDAVTALANQDNAVTPRLALASFERVIAVLIRHRKQIKLVSDEVERCMADIAKYRARAESGLNSRGMTIQDTENIANIIIKLAHVVARLVPLERKAFGLTDTDGPSEFDAMTTEQHEAIEGAIRRALEA